MRKLIVLIAILAIAGGGAYLWIYKKKEVKEQIDSARGFEEAKTPKEAADLFRKAIKERKYDMAAKYCTPKYAEILRSGDEAARKLGKAIDNLSYQLTEQSVMTDEMRVVLYGFDPFAKDISITVGNESDREALATIAPEGIKFVGQNSPFSTWKIDLGFWGAFTAGPMFVPLKVKIVKEGEVWKLDFSTPPPVQLSVSRLNEKYNVYVKKMEIMSTEIKNQADTKENALKRLKELLEDAAKD